MSKPEEFARTSRLWAALMEGEPDVDESVMAACPWCHEYHATDAACVDARTAK